MLTRINGTASLRPPYSYSTSQITEAAEKWLENQPEPLRRKVAKIFHGAEIAKRSCVVPLETVFSDLSFEEKNDLYKRTAEVLTTEVLAKALADTGTKADEIDFLITTSCTGFMIPSVDALLVDRFSMKESIQRLPITEAGCAGGTTGLIFADHFLRANPGKKAAVISFEMPSLTLQKNDLSMENFVSAAIFADGAACSILAGGYGNGMEVIASEMYHFPDSLHFMGYDLRNTGFKIVLDREVPERIEERLPEIIEPFLKRNGCRIDDIEKFIFHPGGKKIISSVERFLRPIGKNIDESKNVLRQYGNMSSATVLFVLKEAEKTMSHGELGLMLAFGPGFSAQMLLLRKV